MDDQFALQGLWSTIHDDALCSRFSRSRPVYGHKCTEILFTSSFIHGRTTTVFCDYVSVAEQICPIVPFRPLKASRKQKIYTNLGGISDILDEHLAAFAVESQVQTIDVFDIADLKRPIKYFWGVHDFIRGLRCAILGHEYLTKMGILHRDISENNIVLARRPGEESGYLIDVDMAIFQEPDEELPVPVTRTEKEEFEEFLRACSADETRPFSRIGTAPYVPFNALYGDKHTYHDDIESFLYVLLLFFLSYGGPLSKEELRDADARGFIQKRRSGGLPHIRWWPQSFSEWAKGNLKIFAGAIKDVNLSPGYGGKIFIRCFKAYMKQNWPEELYDPILRLLWRCWRLFVDSRLQPGQFLSRTKVEHVQFVQVLDEWLKDNGELEDRFSNCPF